jgi:hypothetical protein
MGIQPQTARRFDKSSPVARYWLAQCEGFRVKGPLKGKVVEVVGSGDLQNAEALVVRTARGRRRVPVQDVAVVVPAARLIVVDGRPEPTAAAQRTQAVARASSRAAGSATATVARTAPRAARVAADAARTVAMLVLGGLLTLGYVLLVLGAAAARASSAIARRVRSELQPQEGVARRRR